MLKLWFQEFTPSLIWPAEEEQKLSILLENVEPRLDAGAQIQQMIAAEAFEDYCDSPSIDLSFKHNGVHHKLTIKLPLTLNKFFEPTEMNAEQFFARWKNLGS